MTSELAQPPALRLAQRQIDDFQRRCGSDGDAALRLAYCAALPVALNAELLHLLRINFFLDPPQPLPYTVEFEFLLSPLCRAIDEGLYEIEPTVRDLLLTGLAQHFSASQIRDVATLLWQYVDRHAAWSDRIELARAQQLTALHFLAPDRAKQWLDESEASAGSAPADREWFVAMRQELETQEQHRQASVPDKLQDLLDQIAEAETDDFLELAAIAGLDPLTDFAGADLHGVNMADADLREANLAGANLQGANLIRANLSGANLAVVNFTGANLSEAVLENANLTRAVLDDANLAQGRLPNALLREASLRGADLFGANLNYACLDNADLRNARLNRADLRNARLRSCNLEDADCSGVNFSHADLENSLLVKANLSRSNLSNARLRNANLEIANLTGATLENADLSGAHLDGAHLDSADFSGANLSQSSFSNTVVLNARFTPNSGLSAETKAELRRRGANFLDFVAEVASNFKPPSKRQNLEREYGKVQAEIGLLNMRLQKLRGSRLAETNVVERMRIEQQIEETEVALDGLLDRIDQIQQQLDS